MKPGVGVITPNPKTSGGARWNYLAAWEFAKRQGGSDDKAREFVTTLFKNVPVLDSGARGATNTFVQRGIGDVLLAWENEAYLALEGGKGQDRDRRPLDQHPRRAAGDDRRQERGPQEDARGGRGLPRSSSTRRRGRRSSPGTTTGRATRTSWPKYDASFAEVKLFTIDEAFGGWQTAQKTHFADGGTFDQIYRPGRDSSIQMPNAQCPMPCKGCDG